MEILQAAYTECKARHDRYLAWIAATFNGKNASYKPEDVPQNARVTNDERSAMELYEWLANPPATYFLYVKEGDAFDVNRLGTNKSLQIGGATTWTGTPLGNISFGKPWRDNFGGQRVPVTVYGNNGVHYVGTYFKSSGDYARIRKAARVLCGPRSLRTAER